MLPHVLCRCLGRLLGAPPGSALSHQGSCLLSQPESYAGSCHQLHGQSSHMCGAVLMLVSELFVDPHTDTDTHTHSLHFNT